MTCAPLPILCETADGLPVYDPAAYCAGVRPCPNPSPARSVPRCREVLGRRDVDWYFGRCDWETLRHLRLQGVGLRVCAMTGPHIQAVCGLCRYQSGPQGYFWICWETPGDPEEAYRENLRRALRGGGLCYAPRPVRHATPQGTLFVWGCQDA